MKAKTVFLTVVATAWLASAGVALRYVAGGFFLAIHKTNPALVEANTWSDYWDEYKDDPKEKKRLQGSMGFAVFFLFGMPLIIVAIASSKSRSLHGDARWANHGEISQAGLFAEEGLILGKLGSKFLMTVAPKFVMLVAPPRSGKGVGIIIPNLLNWSQSVVVVDIKSENFNVTSGFRARHGQEVYKFAPFDEKFESHCFNPFSYVSRDPRYTVGELQSIGYMLYPRKDGDSAFFNDAARNLFVAISLYCLESEIHLTMGEVNRRAGGEGRPKDFWQGVADAGVSASGVQLSRGCINALNQFVSNSDNTLTSILATFSAPIGVFSNPVVDAATSSDDFDLRDLRRRKISIYVVVPPNRLAEASLLINLFFSVLIDQNTKTLPEQDPTLVYLALLMMDEMPALGRLEKYVKAVGYLPGYGLRAMMIAQALSQLKERDLYGEEGTRTLATSHTIQILYAPRDQHDAREYSEMLGYYGLAGTSKGTSRSRTGVTNSENVSDQKRALMLPQELREMGADKSIVLTDDCKPIFSDKIKYYADPAFMDRLFPPLTVAALDIDAFIARSESRIRVAGPGEQIPVSRLALTSDTMPQITNRISPVASEVSAMADWLFANVQWVDDSAPLVPAMDKSINTISSEMEMTQ